MAEYDAAVRGNAVDVIWRLEETEGGVQLVRVGARMGWVPEKVSLVRRTEPVLRFESTAMAWPVESWPLNPIVPPR